MIRLTCSQIRDIDGIVAVVGQQVLFPARTIDQKLCLHRGVIKGFRKRGTPWSPLYIALIYSAETDYTYTRLKGDYKVEEDVPKGDRQEWRANGGTEA